LSSSALKIISSFPHFLVSNFSFLISPFLHLEQTSDPPDVSGEARDLVLNCSSESSPPSSPMIDQDDFSAHEGSPPHSDPAVSCSSDLSSPSEPGQ